MSSNNKYRKVDQTDNPNKSSETECGCLGELEKTEILPKFKTCLHTNNLLATPGLNTTKKDALSMSGFKNHELIASLKHLTKNPTKGYKDYQHLQVDFKNDKNKNNTINIDFTKITKNNPITVSLKLFLSKSVCPKTIKKYVDVFQKIYSDTLEKGEYASKKECLEKLDKEHGHSGNSSNISSSRSSVSGPSETYTLDTEMSNETTLDPCSKFKIDMLIISLSKNIKNYNCCNNKDYIIKQYIYPFYQQLEYLVKNDRVKNIGLSDVTTEMLKTLENYCEIKPSVVQVKYRAVLDR